MNYDAQNLRLKNLQTTTAAGRLIQNNSYIYDAVGNILQLTNNADPVTEDHLYGGATTNSYTYDNRYQLISAEGTHQGYDKQHKYNLTMEYGAIGKILRKTQNNQYRKNEGDWLTDATTSMDYTYSYNGQKPHAVSSIEDNNTETLFTYTYDASGNNLLETNNKASSDREIVWTEDNRLAAIKARGNVSHYVYDANGIRTLKMSSSGFNISINGVAAGTDGIDGNFTIYANPYTVVRKNQYTKHFFLGSQRILTKISSSDVSQTFFEGYAENIVPNVDYESKQDDLESNLLLNNKELNIGWYRETRGRIPSEHIKHYLRSKEYGGLSGNNPWQGNTNDIDKTATYEEKQYFFHPDHLGSSNYLTDVLGEAYQHIEYLPWGEIFVEERNTQTSRNTFLYTGKELDEMTGLYYYEQRYYDALKSTFLGVDQLTDKYPHISGFAYVANNPMIFVDPDGKKIVFGKGESLGFKMRFTFTVIKAALVDKSSFMRTMKLISSHNVHTVVSSNLTDGASGFVEPASLANLYDEPDVPKGSLQIINGELKLEASIEEMEEYAANKLKYDIDRTDASNKMKTVGDGSVLHINLSKSERRKKKQNRESSASTLVHEFIHMLRIDKGKVVNRQVEEDHAVDGQNSYIQKENRFRSKNNKLIEKPCQTH